MSTKILWQLSDAFRGSPMPRRDVLTLAVQLLVWTSIGKREWVHNSVPSLDKAAEIGKNLLTAGLAALERSGATLGEAFAGAGRRAELAGTDLTAAAAVCLRLQRDGLLEDLQLDELFYGLGAELGHELMPYHPSLGELMVQLAGSLPGTTTYCPWDQLAQISLSVLRSGSELVVESPLITPFPALAAVFAKGHCRTAYSDPIVSPSFVEGGKLQRFDQAVAFPPIGVKVGRDVITRDLFGRFDNPKVTWSVLCIEHLLAQARRRVVVAVPYSVLSGLGAERILREKMVRRGQVRAVISLFPGLVSGTAIQPVVLVLDPEGGNKQVRFVNASDDRFKRQYTRSRMALDQVGELVNEVHSRLDSDVGRSTDIAEIERSEFSLRVDRYVIDQSTVVLRERLARLKTVSLGALVSTVRTVTASKEDSDVIPAREVGASDIPPVGYVRASRDVVVDRVGANQSEDHYLREGDIVVTIRGNVGKVGIVPSNIPAAGPGGWIAGSSVAVLRLRSESSIDPATLMLLLRSPMGQELLSGISSGVTIPMITLRDLLRLEVPMPLAGSVSIARSVLEQEEDLHREIEELAAKQERIAGSDWAYGLLGDQSTNQGQQ